MILLLGYGIANKSIARYLQSEKIPFAIYDDKITYYKQIPNLDAITLVIKSAGIPNEHFLLQKTLHKEISAISDLEYYYRMFPNNLNICVSGSNGKTTTVSIVSEIFAAADIAANLCGNIGYPLFDFTNTATTNIIEASSFMLEYTKMFSPHISCLLNIVPAHLDHHKTITEYINSKAKIFLNQTKQQFFVYNADDTTIKNILPRVHATKVPFSIFKRVNGAYLENDMLMYHDEFIINTQDCNLIGLHNLQNCLASIAIAKCCNINNALIRQGIKNFMPIEHRIEFIGVRNNLKVYNDSKSTNFFALKTALKSFNNEKILLICGGKLKKDNLNQLDNHLEKITNVYIYGENKYFLSDYFKSKGKNVALFATLEEVTNKINNSIHNEDVLLFSPGSSSLDQFKNYAERGRIFKSYML